jgi:predicted anti-sigma-YlaC factor YlaD
MTDCRLIRRALALKPDGAALDERESEHLDRCRECRKYYEDLLMLTAALNKEDIEPIKADEFALVAERLDEGIARYLNRATGLYRFVIRYGVSAASVFLLIFVSLMSGFKSSEYHKAAVDSFLGQDEYGLQAAEEDSLDSGYIDIVVHDVLNKYGYNTGDMLLGDLSSDELEYIENRLDVGGIL